MSATASRLVLFALVAASPRAPSGSEPHRLVPVFCYVETLFGGAKVEALDLGVCSHVIEAFLIPTGSGDVHPVNGLPREELIRAAHRSGARVLVAVGGATVPGSTFSALAARPEALSRFVDGVVRFVLDGGYDGVDLDWEFPTRSERELQIRIVRALRVRLESAFQARRGGDGPLLLVGVTTGAHLEGYDFPALARDVDYFIQFGYDFRNPALGPWANTASFWPDEATRPVEASIRGVASEVIRRGAPRSKLIVALPFYAGDGRPWVDVRAKALAASPLVDPLYLESPWDGTWITGPAALEAKVRKILSGTEIAGGAAAGIAIWQLGQQGAYRDLTAAISRALPR